MDFHHIPVLPKEVLEALRPAPGRVIVDATLGGGGHTGLLLEAGATVLALDRDEAALEAVEARLGDGAGRLRMRRADFRDLAAVVAGEGMGPVDGILLDLGVSSHQLDTAERGFSFQQDGPLDMRMDRREELSAREIVNHWDEVALKRLLWDFGEERQAKRIVREILKSREERAIETTGELAALVERVLPRRGERRHPATRTFQGLRIAVNRELEVLEAVLGQTPGVLAAGGRLAVITFHSLEDRIVKRFLRKQSERWLDRPEWPEPRPNPDYHFRLVTRRPLEAGEAELRANPRARSAKLRVAERIES